MGFSLSRIEDIRKRGEEEEKGRADEGRKRVVGVEREVEEEETRGDERENSTTVEAGKGVDVRSKVGNYGARRSLGGTREGCGVCVCVSVQD